MSKKEKGRIWDGVSRPATDLYKENFDRIFKNGITEKTDRPADEVRDGTSDERRSENSN